MAGQELEKRCTNFKSCRVGKDDKLQEELDELPEELRHLWIERNFQQFLRKFNTIVEKMIHRPGPVSRTDISELNFVLPFLSELGRSFDRKIHQQLNDCYFSCEKYLAKVKNAATSRKPASQREQLVRLCNALERGLASSCNRYVINVLCTERMTFAPSDCIGRCLALSKHLLNEDEIKEQTLKVEDTLRLESQKPQRGSSGLGNKYILQRISLEFMNKLYIYPLSSTTFPNLPGVYFIYYVGKTELYKGSQVSPSTDLPVYVGKSETSIYYRLIDHQDKIEKAKNLELSDFVVRFMAVDIKYYAPCIEGMLIEHFSPVWNRETVGFSFGNGNYKDNTWNKYHIQKEAETIRTMLRLLRIN